MTKLKKILLSAAGNCVCVALPGHVDSHIFVCGSGQDTKELVEDGGQEVDHHMTLHGVETLEEREREKGVRK